MLPDTAASKVTATHLSRRALLYIRQSSLKQVIHNTESAIRQYHLRGRAKSKQFWNPDKTQFWIDSGVPLVIDRREGYFIYDVEGKRLVDVHLNGGTYNLGHRNPRWSPR